jgi:site-specific DNA-cytosine methylase
MKILDLFSGLGGASQAFVEDPKWEVQRIENNELLNQVPGTTMKSVYELRDELVEMEKQGYVPSDTIDLIWASPPCVEFSLAYSSPQSIALREKRDYQPDLRAVEATIEIIRILKPRYWVIENVRGAVTWFKPLLGSQAKVINHSIFMWGNFPAFVNPKIDSKEVGAGSSKDPLRANKRALIPYAVSKALKDAIETQRSILEWVK